MYVTKSFYHALAWQNRVTILLSYSKSKFYSFNIHLFACTFEHFARRQIQMATVWKRRHWKIAVIRPTSRIRCRAYCVPKISKCARLHLKKQLAMTQNCFPYLISALFRIASNPILIILSRFKSSQSVGFSHVGSPLCVISIQDWAATS